MQLIKLTLSKTDKSRGNSSIVVSYRKARIISNHLAQLNAVLATFSLDRQNYRLRTVKAS